MKRSLLTGLRFSRVLLLALGATATAGLGCVAHINDGSDGAGGAQTSGAGGHVVTGAGGGGGTQPGTGGMGTGGLGIGGGGGTIPGTGGKGTGGLGIGGGGGTLPGTGGKGTGGVIVTGAGGVVGTGGTVGPFEPVAAAAAVRKVKNLLVGLPPTDAEIATVTSMGADGLKTLIDGWTTGTATSGFYKDKMVGFFRNAFQQTGFSPTDDFKPQLLENGGFDFGPLGTGAVGDDIFARLVQNLQDSFALTAWQIVADKQPFTNVLTTQKFMMTTALKSLYIQIEMPNDQPYAFGSNAARLSWKIDMSGNAIPLGDTLNSASPNYMVFDDQAPVKAGGFGLTPNCHGTAQVNAFGGTPSTTGPTGGYAQLFQRLIGYTPRWQFLAQPQCWEHASKPYFTSTDVSDWQWVTIRAQAAGESYIQPYDIPTLRTTTTLGLKLPRVGFYTTPAFLALWNTNDSNQHRVTANQTLLAALGTSFTSANAITPLSTPGLDPAHAVAGSECYGCHKSLDPLRQFWAAQYDFNDRNDFPTRGTFNGGAANPRPSATGGVLAFGSVNASGADMLALGPLLQQEQDLTNASQPLSRFAIAITQKLCYYANSSNCEESDPEFRRIAKAFADSTFAFPTLVRELFSSPLVTYASSTATAVADGITISITRRDQICAALSNRLGITDACALAAAVPSTAQATTLKIVSSVASDAFSRGSEIPVTPPDPTLFYRAASEMLCENVAPMVVDPTAGTNVYPSSAVATSIAAMVTNIVGYPPSDPHYAQAVTILQSHYTAAMTTGKASATNAMRSTFSLACQSPTFLSLGT